MTVLAFSAAGLGIGATILHTVNRVNEDLDPNNQCAPQASTYMAIIVSAIAIPYLCYVTYDEYFNKPYVRTYNSSKSPSPLLTFSL